MLALGEVIGGRYRLGPLIGRGGMADVHRGEDLLTGDAVAIKLLRPGPTIDRWSAREVAALSRLDHPAIVRLRAWDIDGDEPHLVLDLIEGEALSDVIRRQPLAPPWAVAVMAEVADGLAQAHACGVVHRDVKPSNILLDLAGRPHLADFGVARLVDATATTAAGFIIGTAAYLAPEQVRGERAGPPADVYALGLVLLECLTGRRAYPGTFNEAAAAHLARGPDVPAAVPPALAAVVHAATSRRPALRPSAGRLAAALRTATLSDDSPATQPLDAAGRTEAIPIALVARRPSRRSRAALVAVLVAGSAVGVAGGLAVAASHGGDSTPSVVTTIPPAPASSPPPTAPPPTTAAPPTTTPSTAPSSSASQTTQPKKGKDHDKSDN